MLVALALVALVVAACSGADMSGPIGQRVEAWAQATGWSSSLATLSGDVSRLAASEHAPGAAGVSTNCRILEDDAQQANGSLPTPDALLTAQLSDAYEDFGAAGSRCASSRVTPAVQTSLDQAAAHLARARQRYLELTAVRDAK